MHPTQLDMGPTQIDLFVGLTQLGQMSAQLNYIQSGLNLTYNNMDSINLDLTWMQRNPNPTQTMYMTILSILM